MKKLLALVPLALAAASHAGTIDTRLSYDGISKQFSQRLYIGNTWANGVGASADSTFLLSSVKDRNEVDTMRTVSTELVAWWTYKISPDLYLRPGLSTVVNASGTTSRPYAVLGFKIDGQWDASLRYRPNFRNYDTKDLGGQLARDNNHNLTLWAGYRYSESVNFEYQLDYLKKANNYNFDNGKKTIFEHEVVATFPNGFGKGLTPYILIDHLGDSIVSGQKKTHWRPRAGIKIAF
jgi:hypothetical protein